METSKRFKPGGCRIFFSKNAVKCVFSFGHNLGQYLDGQNFLMVSNKKNICSRRDGTYLSEIDNLLPLVQASVI